MAKLSEAMVKGLRAVQASGGVGVPARTLAALTTRGLIDPMGGGAYALTKHGACEAAYQAERATRLVPVTLDEAAAVQSERKQESFPPATTGPVVRLTPDSRALAPDADVLQLLSLLDSGVRVTREPFTPWRVLDAPMPLDAARVDAAARHAVWTGLARQVGRGNGVWALIAESIHLDTGTGMTGCGVAQSHASLRRRWTTDPSRVTHDRCKP